MQQRRVPSQAAPPSPDAAQPIHSSHSLKIHSLMSATYRNIVWSIHVFVSCDSHSMHDVHRIYSNTSVVDMNNVYMDYRLSMYDIVVLWKFLYT